MPSREERGVRWRKMRFWQWAWRFTLVYGVVQAGIAAVGNALASAGSRNPLWNWMASSDPILSMGYLFELLFVGFFTSAVLYLVFHDHQREESKVSADG